MDSRWIQGKIEEFSFLELAKIVLPSTEFPVFSYPYVQEATLPNMEKMRANMIPRFHYSTKEEEQAILSGNWDAEKNYENSEMPYGFYFIDVPLGELSRYFPTWFNDKNIDELIKSYYTEEDGNICFSKKTLTKAVFCILHEYGHYLDYKRLGKEQVALWIYDAKSIFREHELKIKEMQEQGTLTKEIYESREKIYRNCEDEYSADMYALSQLRNKVREAFEYIDQERADETTSRDME